ncbi:hypothetical protein [Pseudomonas nicosulfuronedens]
MEGSATAWSDEQRLDHGAARSCHDTKKKSAGVLSEISASFCSMNAANRTFQPIITTIAPMVG